MAGGTAVVTATGAGLGGALGASVTTAYAGSDPSFAIELVESGVGPAVVFADGFLSEDRSGWGDWELLIRARYPGSTVYRLRWGARELKTLQTALVRDAATKVTLRTAAGIAQQATRKALGQFGMIGGVLSAAELAKNPWWVAKARANMTGAVLADLIARTVTEEYVLVGHSLGARVMATAARALGSDGEHPRLQSVHLLGAAISSRLDLHDLGEAVSGTVWNYWSDNDSTLNWLYRGAQFNERATGAVGFTTTHPKMKNRHVSRQVKSHSDYLQNVRLR